MAEIKCIGILTSGGDSPGMNAAIRAVTRMALCSGLQVKGIMRGYKGLISGEIIDLKTENVSNTIQRGGTILKTARCKEFETVEGRQQAFETLQREGIDALVAIGGNGTLSGAMEFAMEHDVAIVGLPATIDNDLNGTDITIGYDTTLNTIVGTVDKLRDTASSHDRIFFVEVMGREAGFLAAYSAIATGAEAAIVPEIPNASEQFAEFFGSAGLRKTKGSSIVIVAEGEEGGAMGLAEKVKSRYPQYDIRVSIMGHMQRGGSPSARDRIIAGRMGESAIHALTEGVRNVMIGIEDEKIVFVPFSRAVNQKKPLDLSVIDSIKKLSV